MIKQVSFNQYLTQSFVPVNAVDVDSTPLNDTLNDFAVRNAVCNVRVEAFPLSLEDVIIKKFREIFVRDDNIVDTPLILLVFNRLQNEGLLLFDRRHTQSEALRRGQRSIYLGARPRTVLNLVSYPAG